MKSKVNPFRSHAISGAAVIFACFSMLNAKAQATDAFFVGSAGDHNLTNNSNWVGGSHAADWDRMIFGSAVVDGTLNIDNFNGRSGITLTSGVTKDITINGPQPLIMGSVTSDGFIDMSSAAHDLTINTQYWMWSNMEWNVGAGRTLVVNGGIVQNNAPGITLAKGGPGTAWITSPSSYTGGTAINSGTLVATRSALGTGSVVINNGGVLYVNDQWVLCGVNGFGVTERNVGSVTVNAGGQIALDGGNGFANGVTNLYLNGGSVTGGLPDTNPNSAFGGLYLYNGNEQITAGGATTSTISTSLALTGNNNTITVDTGSSLNITNVLKNGVFDGGASGGFIKAGSGIMTLSGANTHTLSTTLSQGLLHFSTFGQPAVQGPVKLSDSGGFLVTDQPNQFGPNSTLTFNVSSGYGEFALYGHDQTIAGLSSTNGFAVVENSHSGLGPASADSTLTINQNFDSTYSGWIRDNTGNDAFTLSLVKNGSGSLALAGSQYFYTGSTTINSGRIEYNGTAPANSTSKITVNGGYIYFNPASTNGTVTAPIELNGVGNGAGALQNYVEGGQLTFSGPITLLGNSQIQGFAAGSTLNFTNTIDGTGNLTFRANGAAPDHKDFMVLSAASNFNGDLYIENYAASAEVQLSGGDDRLPTTAVVHLGAGKWSVDSGNPSLITSSALDLNGNNQITAGLSDSGVSSLVGPRSVVNTSGTQVTLTLNTPSDQSFSGTIGGTDIWGSTGNNLALVKSGAGTQTLSGANTYSGGTNITNGTIMTVATNAIGSGAVTVANGANWIMSANDQTYTIAGLSGSGNVTRVAQTALGVTTGADGASQISPAKSYVQLLDFGNGGGSTVNGVAFQSVYNSGPNWTLSGATNQYNADAGSGYSQLMSDFVYGGTPGVMTFSNLTPGKTYQAMLYTQVGVWGSRQQDGTFTNGTNVETLSFEAGNVGYVAYSFTATDSTATISMAPQDPGSTFHWYGASLEDQGTGGGSTITVGDAGSYTFSGVLSGNISLIKQGSGVQTLSGANTYAGTTTVNRGTLALGVSNVLPDGTNVSLGTATLDGGTSTDTAGTLAISGNGIIHLGAGAALAFANSRSVSWTGTLTLTGAFVSGSSLRFGTNSSGLTSGQLASITKPGGGSVALDANGYLVDASGYSNWASINAPTGTAGDDFDGDGVSNAVEYVLGGTRNSRDLSKLPAISTSGGNLVFTFLRDQASIDGTTAVAIQVGTNLSSWPDSFTVPGNAQVNNPGVTIQKNTPRVGTDTVILTVPKGSAPTKFARLAVTPAP